MIQPLDIKEFKTRVNEGHSIIDTRSSETFAEGFMPGSISIPFNTNFMEWLQELTDDDQRLVLVADESEVAAIDNIIRLSGLSTIDGYLKGGWIAWRDVEKKFDLLITIDADEFEIDYQFDEFYLVDVRSKEGFENEHAEDAENVTLSDLEYIISEFDEDLSYYIYGETAAEAITAGSIVRKLGFERIRVVAADYATIKASKVPFVKKKKTPSPDA